MANGGGGRSTPNECIWPWRPYGICVIRKSAWQKQIDLTFALNRNYNNRSKCLMHSFVTNQKKKFFFFGGGMPLKCKPSTRPLKPHKWIVILAFTAFPHQMPWIVLRLYIMLLHGGWCSRRCIWVLCSIRFFFSTLPRSFAILQAVLAFTPPHKKKTEARKIPNI